MGQATSKRRSYTPSNSTKASDSALVKSNRTNGNIKSSGLANGSIEERSPGSSDNAQIEADDTTSPTSVTSDTSTGRKENKRRRFRVSGLFSLKRTPSGKWPRRRKTASSAVNGTRPASCPEAPHEAQGVASPARPQSLFLEELEITEDDNKIETVDLSDHEQDGKSKEKTGKASGVDTPKAPPKTKGRRGSKKQSSIKKKKQEKKSSKKDKKNKSKQKSSASEAEDHPTSGAELEVASPTTIKSEFPENVESVKASNAAEKAIPCLTAAEEKDNSTSLATGLTQQVLAHIDAKSKEEKVEESVEQVKKDNEEEDDLDAVASSIVAETMDIAQKRLGEETILYCKDAPEVHASDSSDKVEEDILKDAQKVIAGKMDKNKEEEIEAPSREIQAESTPPVVEAEIHFSPQTTQESSPSPQAPPRRRHSATPSGDIELPNSHPVDVEKVDAISVSKSAQPKSKATEPTVGSDAIKEKVVEKVKEQVQQLVSDVQVEPQILHTVSLPAKEEVKEAPKEETCEKKSSDMPLVTEHFHEAAVDVGAEVAVVSAAVVALESENIQNGTDDGKNTHKEKVKTASFSSDIDKQSKSEAVEKKRLEKERLRKEKEAEKAKEK